MKKSELFKLLQSLQGLSHYQGARFAYGVAKNIKALHDECSILEKLIEYNGEFKEYEFKRIALVESFAEKNEDGSAKIKGNEYVLSSEARLQFEEALKQLNEEYAEVLEARKKQVADFNSLLEEETDIQLFKIKESLLPETMTVAQVLSIMNVIEEG